MNDELTELENKIKAMSHDQLVEYYQVIRTVGRFFTVIGVTSIFAALMHTTIFVMMCVSVILYIIGNMAVELDRIDNFAKSYLEKKSIDK